VTIACGECNHSAELKLTHKQSLVDRNDLKFRCSDCGGEGRLVPDNPSKQSLDQTLQREQCAECQRLISDQRLEAMPGTRLCVECASSTPHSDKRRFIGESWGSREAFKKDKGSWRRQPAIMAKFRRNF
jgi:hypothetical protein